MKKHFVTDKTRYFLNLNTLIMKNQGLPFDRVWIQAEVESKAMKVVTEPSSSINFIQLLLFRCHSCHENLTERKRY